MGGPSSSPRCIGGKLQHGLRCHGRFKFWHFRLRAARQRRSSLTNRLATDWIHAPFPLGNSLRPNALDRELSAKGFCRSSRRIINLHVINELVIIAAANSLPNLALGYESRSHANKFLAGFFSSIISHSPKSCQTTMAYEKTCVPFSSSWTSSSSVHNLDQQNRCRSM